MAQYTGDVIKTEEVNFKGLKDQEQRNQAVSCIIYIVIKVFKEKTSMERKV